MNPTVPHIIILMSPKCPLYGRYSPSTQGKLLRGKTAKREKEKLKESKETVLLNGVLEGEL